MCAGMAQAARGTPTPESSEQASPTPTAVRDRGQAEPQVDEQGVRAEPAAPLADARAIVRWSADGLAQRECDRGADGAHAQWEAGAQPPVVISVQEVEDLAPLSAGRQWTADQYHDRDAVLRALGVPSFRPPDRRRARPCGSDDATVTAGVA